MILDYLKLSLILEQEREAILGWISDIDYGSHHKTILDKLMNDTGNWIFAKDEYVRWMRDDSISSLLWLRGDGPPPLTHQTKGRAC